MKKFNKILLVIMFVFVVGISFSGCRRNNDPVQLNAPQASVEFINGSVRVVTTSNPNVERYVYGIYSGPSQNNLSLYLEQESTVNHFNVNAFVINSDVYYFYVRLIGKEPKYLDSAPSSIVSYDNSENLPSPVLQLDDTQLSWTAVPNNSGYKVFKNNVLLTTTQNTTYSIANQITSAIVYDFEVQAIGSTGTATYLDSLKSNTVSYTDHLILETPTNLTVEQNIEQENYLTWDAVQYASGYTVLVDNEEEFVVETNEFVIDSVLTVAKPYNFKVKSNATGVLIESDYSNTLTYDNYLTLTTPTILGASRNGSDVLVAWETVENAESYTLLINGEPLKDISENIIIIYDTQVLISDDDLEEKPEGGFDFEVYANAYSYYLQSETSELFFYSGIDLLTEPENLLVNYDQVENTVVLGWDEVEGADSYLIAIDNEVTQAFTNSIELQEELTVDEVVELRVKAIGSGYVEDSEFSEPIIFNYTTNYAPGYVDKYFYYYDYYDYYIDSQEELNAFIGYLISYHIESDDPDDRATAYIDYNLTSSELIEADEDGNNNGVTSDEEIINYKQNIALLSYTETHSLTYDSPVTDGPSGKEYKFRLTFSYDIDPSLTSTEPVTHPQDADYTPYQSSTGRDSGYDDFAPENLLVEVEVYNSENLFMAINSGAKPKFMTEDSQAEQVYEAAKTVLRQIIDNDMTDYQKMLAIFDYVNYNTVYDHYVLNLATQGGSGETLPEYRVFYLEGVILDGKAVCDGIAKTIALLANMEGIEAIKINGTSNSQGSSVGHAWNKVYLEIDGVYDWYVIDATWGVVLAGEEVLAHDYFLINDADIADSHFAASTYNPVSDAEFDYYSYTEYAEGKNYYIEDQTELNDLVEHLLTNGDEGVEIFVDEDFTSLFANKLQTAVNNAGVSGSSASAYSYTSSVSGETIYLIDFSYD
jgi:hypothetical protein